MIDTDIPSLVPEILDRQARTVLNPVEFAENIDFPGYTFRLEPQIEMRRLDTQP